MGLSLVGAHGPAMMTEYEDPKGFGFSFKAGNYVLRTRTIGSPASGPLSASSRSAVHFRQSPVSDHDSRQLWNGQ